MLLDAGSPLQVCVSVCDKQQGWEVVGAVLECGTVSVCVRVYVRECVYLCLTVCLRVHVCLRVCGGGFAVLAVFWVVFCAHYLLFHGFLSRCAAR